MELTELSNHWYEVIEKESLEQGDILENVDVVVPTYEFLMNKTEKVSVSTYEEVIVLTQSCDIGNKKTPWIYVSPVTKISKMKATLSNFNDLNFLENVRRGFVPKYHMLNEFVDTASGMQREIDVIDFRDVF
jgi:hypothetical protein